MGRGGEWREVGRGWGGWGCNEEGGGEGREVGRGGVWGGGEVGRGRGG